MDGWMDGWLNEKPGGKIRYIYYVYGYVYTSYTVSWFVYSIWCCVVFRFRYISVSVGWGLNLRYVRA